MIEARSIADAINQLGDGQEVVLHLYTGQLLVIAIVNGQLYYHNIASGTSNVSIECASLTLTSAFVDGNEVVIVGENVFMNIPENIVESIETRSVEFLDEGCGL